MTIRIYADDEWTDQDKQDLAAKIDWEGGIFDTINGYGLTVETACSYTVHTSEDAPKPMPKEVEEAWNRIRAVEKDARIISEWLDY